MGMAIDKAIKMLIAKEKCMERETSGIDTDCNNHNCDNCDLCYEQGNMGEQKETLKYAIETMRKYQQLQADYENRLKADLKAILVELQLEIEESENCGKAFHLGLQMASKIIQQKINALRGEEE